MGNAEEKEQPGNRIMDGTNIEAVGSLPAGSQSATTLLSQTGGTTRLVYGAEGDSHSDGAETSVSSYIYALGRIDARFPSLAIEKEYDQVVADLPEKTTIDQTDKQILHTVLYNPDYRYLARQMCWVLTIERIDHYILLPRDPADLDLLLQAIKPDEPKHSPVQDVDTVIGVRGPLAPPDMYNGLILPIVIFDMLYSFSVGDLVDALTKKVAEAAEAAAPKTRRKTAQRAIILKLGSDALELFERVVQIADNAGATDEHRALNYLAVRTAKIYEEVVKAHAQSCSLTAIDVYPSRLGGARKVVDVIFSFTNRQTGVTDKFFVRVDVTEEFPFLVNKWQPYYNR